MKIKIMLCGNQDECRHYMQQEYSQPGNESKKYRVSSQSLELANDDVRIMFVTPDNIINKLTGMTIDRYIDVGTAYKHRDYHQAMDILKIFKRA